VGFIAVNDVMQFVLVKCLIRKKEVKIRSESIAMALTSVDTFIKPDEPPEKKKDKNQRKFDELYLEWEGGTSCTED
jgi:hypothetical protein